MNISDINPVNRIKNNEWTVSSPLFLREIRILSDNENKKYILPSVYNTTREKIESYVITATFSDRYGKPVSEGEEIRVMYPENSPVRIESGEAYDVKAKITSVRFANGTEWNSGDLDDVNPGEGETIWQTDRIYGYVSKLKQEIPELKEAKYYPRDIKGAWICSCGRINLDSESRCNGCGIDHEILKSAFDSGKELETMSSEDEDRAVKEIKKEKVIKGEAEKLISDKAKAVLILAAAVAFIAFIIIYFTVISPAIRYSGALKDASAGNYDKAIEALDNLGDYRDSKDLVLRYTYEKYRTLTGEDEIIMTTTDESPWFVISDDGTLSFKNDKYTGSWGLLEIPHVVNGIIVKKLEKSAFINSDIESAVIPSTVNVIGEQAFMNCKKLKSIIIGTGVESIEQRAFVNCSSLEKIEIPDNVKSVGTRAFNNCTALVEIVLGSQIHRIEPYLFSYCLSLETLEARSYISFIGNDAFFECNSLKKVSIPEGENAPEIEEGNECFTRVYK